MDGPRSRCADIRKNERGFTLAEALVTIAILGVLMVIAVIVLFGILERRKVDAAARQLAADMRLAHTSATNQLTDWRIVLVPGRGDEDEGPDYFLIRLDGVYEEGFPKPTASTETSIVSRTLPANVEVMIQRNKNDVPIQDNKGKTYYLSPRASLSDSTRTLEFNTDGAMTGYGSPSGTVRVTVDEDPQGQVGYVAATSRVRILP